MSTRDLKQTIRSIREAERAIQPDPAWVSHTRETLLMQVANSMPTRLPSWRVRIREAARSFLPRRFSLAMRGPAAILSTLGIVLSGSIASVSAAERAVPGDFLYPVKLATEQTRLILTKDKSDRLKLKTEFVSRRVIEMKTIVSENRDSRKERIQEAAEILKRDLDTVKSQLHDVQAESSVAKTVRVAKEVDRVSTAVAQDLKSVKTTLDGESKAKVVEAETAAVNTGVKAVQVMIDEHDKPEAQQEVSNAELWSAVQTKVDGLQENISNAAQELTGSSIVSATSTASATSTMAGLAPGTASSSLSQILDAQSSLAETKQLILENKLDEGMAKLTESAKAVASLESSVAVAVASSTNAGIASGFNASSTGGLLPSGNASGTLDGTSGESTSSNASSTVSATTVNSTSTPLPK